MYWYMGGGGGGGGGITVSHQFCNTVVEINFV